VIYILVFKPHEDHQNLNIHHPARLERKAKSTHLTSISLAFQAYIRSSQIFLSYAPNGSTTVISVPLLKKSHYSRYKHTIQCPVQLCANHVCSRTVAKMPVMPMPNSISVPVMKDPWFEYIQSKPHQHPISSRQIQLHHVGQWMVLKLLSVKAC